MRMRMFCCLLLLVVLVVAAAPVRAGRTRDTARGQTVYVPVYSHVYQGPRSQPYSLSVLLSIRNVDAEHAITLESVKFYDDAGRLLKEHLVQAVEIPPLGTEEVLLPERDPEGGSGANFTVTWQADRRVTVPIIQAVMIGTASTQGISFVCDGVTIAED